MCLITMGLLAALAPAALYVGLMVWKDGGETPRRSDARAQANDEAASARLQHPVDRRPSNLEGLRDL